MGFTVCYTEGMLFFPKPLLPGKHFIWPVDLNWNSIILLLLTSTVFRLEGVSMVLSKHSEPQ